MFVNLLPKTNETAIVKLQLFPVQHILPPFSFRIVLFLIYSRYSIGTSTNSRFRCEKKLNTRPMQILYGKKIKKSKDKISRNSSFYKAFAT